MFGKKKHLQQFKQQEKEWQKKLTSAEAIADEQSELVAKELRTPLVKLQRLLQESVNNNTSETQFKETVEKTLTEITDYKNVIDAIFSITRANLYKEAGLFVPIDITKATQEVANQFQSTAKEKGLSFILDFDPNLTYPAHPTYFRKMISFLIDNAIKYTKQGQVQLSLKRVKNDIVLLIEDTGHGMEPEQISKALKRFYRTEKSRKENISGHGLGLNLAQWIARLHGADLEVTSMTDKGTSMVIRFPLNSQV